MDELDIFRRLADKAEQQPSGLGDIRASVWSVLAEKPVASLVPDSFSRQAYFSRMSSLINCAAAALALVCSGLSVCAVYDYMASSSMYSSYYDLLGAVMGAFR